MRPIFLILLAALAALSPLTASAQSADAATIAIAVDTESEAEAVLEQEVVEEQVVVDPLEPRSAEGLTLDDFLWVARPIVVFADTPADPRFIEQMELLTQRPEALLERNVVIIVDTDPDARSAIRLALRPRGFSMVILDVDGTIGLRRPGPRDVREIIRAIDNFQMRQEELRQGE